MVSTHTTLLPSKPVSCSYFAHFELGQLHFMIFIGNYSGSLDSRQQILDMINIATLLYYLLPASLLNDKTVRFCQDQNRNSLEAEVGS